MNFFQKIRSKRFAICNLCYILSNMHQRVQGCFGKPTWRNWQTRTVQVRVPRGMWVRLPPTVPFFLKNQGVNHSKISEIFCGYGITAVHQPSKLDIRVRLPLPAPVPIPCDMIFLCGWIPERPKGADCKSASDAFDGSNPSPATIFVNQHQFKLVFFLCLQNIVFRATAVPRKSSEGGVSAYFFRKSDQ